MSPPPLNMTRGAQGTRWAAWFAGLHAACAVAGQTEDERLVRARDFIDAHCCEPIDLDTVARCALMSRYHFLRSFRRAFGLTPHQHLTRQRLLRARHLLRETDMSVTEVLFSLFCCTLFLPPSLV